MTMRRASTSIARGMFAGSALVALAACQHDPIPKDLQGLIQPGQIVGGATKQMAGAQAVGGFLPDPSLLSTGGPGQADLTYLNAGVNPAMYRHVLLEPVTIMAASDSELSKLSPAQRQAVVNTFHSDLYSALSKGCSMTTTPRPGTLRLRVALVGAHLPNAVVNTVATYAPYESAAYSAASLVFNNGIGYFAGTATAEGYAEDARKGTLVWQAVDRRGGTTAALENTLNTWLDVHHAFEMWSTELATKFQQMGFCRKAEASASKRLAVA